MAATKSQMQLRTYKLATIVQFVNWLVRESGLIYLARAHFKLKIVKFGFWMRFHSNNANTETVNVD